MKNRAQRRAASKADPVEEPAAAEPAEVPTELTLKGTKGDLKIRIVVPRSLGVRYEVTYAIAESELKAGCAALGVCSSSIQQHVRWTKKSAALGYGADVLEWLLGEGVPYNDILNAGRLAWYHVSRGLIPGREVDEAEGFSEPPSGGSTG